MENIWHRLWHRHGALGFYFVDETQNLCGAKFSGPVWTINIMAGNGAGFGTAEDHWWVPRDIGARLYNSEAIFFHTHRP